MGRVVAKFSHWRVFLFFLLFGSSEEDRKHRKFDPNGLKGVDATAPLAPYVLYPDSNNEAELDCLCESPTSFYISSSGSSPGPSGTSDPGSTHRSSSFASRERIIPAVSQRSSTLSISPSVSETTTVTQGTTLVFSSSSLASSSLLSSCSLFDYDCFCKSESSIPESKFKSSPLLSSQTSEVCSFTAVPSSIILRSSQSLQVSTSEFESSSEIE